MHATVRRDDLLAAAMAMAKIADRQSSMPIIRNVLIRAERGEVVLAATDLNITGQWPIGATVKTEGAITVEAKHFVTTMKGLPKGAMVTLRIDPTEATCDACWGYGEEGRCKHGEPTRGRCSTVKSWRDPACPEVERVVCPKCKGRKTLIDKLADGRLIVECGEQAFKVVGMAARDFPKMPAPPADWFPVSAPALFGSLSAVVNTISTDETRYHLNGACLISEGSTLTAISTDGHRLSRDVRDVGGTLPELKRCILPRGAVKLLVGLLKKEAGKVSIAASAPETGKPYSPYPSYCGGVGAVTHLHFKIGDLVISGKLIEAQFPPTEQVEYTAETRPATFKVDASALADAVKRARLVAIGKSMEEITLCVVPGVLRVSSGKMPLSVLERWEVDDADRKLHADLVEKWQARADAAARAHADFDEASPGKAGHWEEVKPGDFPLPADAETRIVADGAEWFSEDIAVDFDGTPRACSINARCLLEPLAKADGIAEVGIDADDPLKQVSLVVNGRSHVIMPMRGVVAPVEVRDEKTRSKETIWTWAIGVWPVHGEGLPYAGEEPAAAPAKPRKVKAAPPPPAAFEDEPTIPDAVVPAVEPAPQPVERPSVVTMTCGTCVAGVVRYVYEGREREETCTCWFGQMRARQAA